MKTTGTPGPAPRSRSLRSESKGSWVLYAEGDPAERLGPLSFDEAALRDLEQLERIADFLSSKFPWTRGMEVDEAVVAAIGRLEVSLTRCSNLATNQHTSPGTVREVGERIVEIAGAGVSSDLDGDDAAVEAVQRFLFDLRGGR